MDNHSILAVLNDDETRRQIIRSLNGSFRVNETGTFSNAIEILRSEQTNLIIADIRVHDAESDFASVFDFMRWVKGDPIACSIPFVCLSSKLAEFEYQADALRIAARSLGAAKYLSLDKFDQSIFRQEIEWLLPEELDCTSSKHRIRS
jgi:CheY-like chemotaxis protein